MVEENKAFQIRLSGIGGQGLVLAARVLAEAVMLEGKTVAQSQSYEPVSRGGVSRSDLVVGEGLIDYPLVTDLDLLLILEQSAVEVSADMVSKSGIVLSDNARVTAPPQGEFRVYTLPLTETARTLGNVRMTNMVALGATAVLSEVCQLDSLQQALRSQMAKRFWETGNEALRMGTELAASAITAN